MRTSDSRHLQADSRQASSALNSKGNDFEPAGTVEKKNNNPVLFILKEEHSIYTRLSIV